MNHNQAGKITREIFNPHNLRYTFAHPASRQLNQNVPLILALHWGGFVTPFYGEGLLLGLINPALADLDAFICAPDCECGDWTDPEFEPRLLDLFDNLISTHPIDTGRILITGYSIGGIGTWEIASRNMSIFAGALPISSPVPEIAMKTDWKIPLCVIHSRQDELFAYRETRRAVSTLANSGVDIELITVEGPGHFETYGFIQPLQGAVPWIREILVLPGKGR